MSGWSASDLDRDPLREILEQVLAEHRRQLVPDDGRERMPINVFHEDRACVIEAALPGVDQRSIDLRCDEHVLTIRARLQVPDRTYLQQEIRSSDLERQVALPAGCQFEAAEANLEAGILRVRMPIRRPPGPSRIRIEVTRGGTPPSVDIDRLAGDDPA